MKSLGASAKDKKAARNAREAVRFRTERSRQQVKKYSEDLSNVLGLANDEQFLQLIWAVHALQSGREENVQRILEYPAEAATSQYSDKLHIHEWELETLANEILTRPKRRLKPGPNRVINCRKFTALAATATILRRLENAQSGTYLNKIGIWTELHRISQRQFPWQRGFDNACHIYKFAYMYGGEETNNYYLLSYGVSIQDALYCGFALCAMAWSAPYHSANVNLSAAGIGNTIRDKTLARISIDHISARNFLASNPQTDVVAYRSSILRKWPIINFHGRNRTPLPNLIIDRLTSGIFYDLVEAPSGVRNEVADRFEQYTRMVIDTLSGASTTAKERYTWKKNKLDAPDIVLGTNSGSIIVECKARRMPMTVRYGDNPLNQAADAFSEIAKGVVQIWRYVAHIRLGAAQLSEAQLNLGLIVTLDSWISHVGSLKDHVMLTARDLAKKYDEISDEDKIPIAFTSTDDLDLLISASNAETFYQTVDSGATMAKYDHWSLPNIFEDLELPMTSNQYPFDQHLHEVIPRWTLISDLIARSDRTKNPSQLSPGGV